MTRYTEDITETQVLGQRIMSIDCDLCGLSYPPGAIGLVQWLTLAIGYRRQDGGHIAAGDKDFCSAACLTKFLAEQELHISHPIRWEHK